MHYSQTYLDPQPRLVQVNQGEPRVISSNRKPRNSRVVSTTEHEPRFIEERYVGERVINTYTRNLEERVISGQKPQMRRSVKEVDTWEDEPIIQERIVEKPVEVIVEKKVPVERYIDVPYDVIVEKPVERIIEKEIQIEKIQEREIEKVIEIPVEKIIEVPIEKVIEKPV